MPGMKSMLKKIKDKNKPKGNTGSSKPKNEKLPENVNYQKDFNKEDLLQTTPAFRDVGLEHRKPLLIKKLRLCSIIFDFANESSQENLGKEMKRQMLLEIVDHITTTKHWFDEQVLVEILQMVRSNLFRTLPPSGHVDFDPEQDDPTLRVDWSHMQICYEFLLRFVVSSYTDPKLMKKHIDKKFILNIIDLFESEDPRERDYLKTILHRIYGKHNGISELLEILGSIINGFALPLKQEHKNFLRNVLIPLHKVKCLSQFHQQLAYCVTQFIDKDSSLASVVIGGLLKFWPCQSSQKQLLFLNELEEVLEITPSSTLAGVMNPLFRRIADSICSPHFQVAERALFLWNNEIISQFTSDNRSDILPILYPALHKSSTGHWNPTVHSLTFNIIRMFMEMDSDLFEKVSKSHEEVLERTDEDMEEKERKQVWAYLAGGSEASGDYLSP